MSVLHTALLSSRLMAVLYGIGYRTVYRTLAPNLGIRPSLLGTGLQDQAFKLKSCSPPENVCEAKSNSCNWRGLHYPQLHTPDSKEGAKHAPDKPQFSLMWSLFVGWWVYGWGWHWAICGLKPEPQAYLRPQPSSCKPPGSKHQRSTRYAAQSEDRASFFDENACTMESI